MMILGHLKKSFGSWSTIMSKQSVRQNLSSVAKGKTRLKVNESWKEQDPRMQVRKRMLYLTRILMDLSLENNRIEVMVGDSCSARHVVRSISRRIFHKIRVIDLTYIVHRRHILLGMLEKSFHGSMKHWIVGFNPIQKLRAYEF